jgi:hypothetical protein
MTEMNSKSHLELLLELDVESEDKIEELRKQLGEKEATLKIEKLVDTGRTYQWQPETLLHIVEIYVLPALLPVVSSIIYTWIKKGKIVIRDVNLDAAAAIALAHLKHFRKIKSTKMVSARSINAEYEFEFKGRKSYCVVVGKDGDVKSTTTIG